MKKWLWFVVIFLPIGAVLLTLRTMQSIEVGYSIIAPRYVETTESALAELDSKVLAKLSASLLNDHKKLSEWWRWARDEYELTTYVLLGLVFLLAAILGAVLWRMPSNPAPNTDAGHAPRAG